MWPDPTVTSTSRRTTTRLKSGHMPNAELRIIPPIWGHLPGGPGFNSDDTRFIDLGLKGLLAS